MTRLSEPFDALAYANRPEPKAAYISDENPRAAFVDEMRSYGFDGIPASPAIGRIERCKSPGDKGTKKSGWYIYNEIADDYKPGAYIGIGVFGSWNGDPERIVWTSKRRESMSPAESARFEEQLRAEKIARDEELKAVRAAAAEKAATIWAEATPAPAEHPYLTAKGVQPHGVRVSRGNVVVPVYERGVMVSLQFVDVNGGKKFLSGGKTKGCAFKIEGDPATVYVCEGFATGATLAEATGATVYVAFNAGNLLEVTSAAKDAHSDSEIIIAGDDDHKTDGNPGRSKAVAAGDAMRVKVIFPEVDGNDTDFNDMAKTKGIEAVRALVERKQGTPLCDAKKIEHTSMNWAACLGDPPEREWVLDGLIPRGHITSMYADGGVGKTLLSQQLATSVATSGEGGRFLGRQIRGGPVLALFAEDDEAELWRRQVAINGCSGTQMTELKDSHTLSGFGYDNLLMTFDRSAGLLTDLYSHLMNTAMQLRPELIIIDNAADTFGGEENSRAQVNQFVKVALGGLARETGAAVLLLAHPSIFGMQNKTGSSGSTAWNNAVRSRIFMERMDKDDANFDADVRYLSLLKANYAATGDGDQIRWKDGAFVLEKKDDGGFVAHLDTKQKCRIVLEELARVIDGGENLSPNSRAGNNAAKRLMDAEPIHKRRIKKSEISKHIDRLQRDGMIEVEPYSRNGRTHDRYVLTDGGDAALKGEG